MLSACLLRICRLWQGGHLQVQGGLHLQPCQACLIRRLPRSRHSHGNYAQRSSCHGRSTSTCRWDMMWSVFGENSSTPKSTEHSKNFCNFTIKAVLLLNPLVPLANGVLVNFLWTEDWTFLWLIAAANESCPQPQTSEHLAAIEIMKLKHILILQNKIDLTTEAQVWNTILNWITSRR